MKKIGIVGLGMVGGQLLRWCKANKISHSFYDKYKKVGALKDLDKSDIIFLCLPTPHKNNREGVELGPFKEIISHFKDPKIFIIKSTVPVGTTNFLQNEFKEHFFLHSPEFLTESTAWKDFSKPLYQLLGHTSKSKRFSRQVMNLLPKGRYNKIMTSSTTELFKYTRNSYFAIKVTYANQIFELCQKMKINYNDIKELLEKDPWIGNSHLNIFHKGYRGFGGKCLPKDLRTFIKIFEKEKFKPDLLQTVDRINTKLIKKQGLEKVLKNKWLENKDHTI